MNKTKKSWIWCEVINDTMTDNKNDHFYSNQTIETSLT